MSDHAAKVTRHLAKQEAFTSAPFALIDVGCSGGISPMWRVFRNDLIAAGFAPMADECKRLQPVEKNNDVQYINKFGGLDYSHPFSKQRREAPDVNAWARLSTAEDADFFRDANQREERTTPLNGWHTRALSSNQPITLDKYVTDNSIQNLDFLKVDVDEKDIEVLLTCGRTFASLCALGVQVECNLEGNATRTQDSFQNVEKMLRGFGFDLYDMNLVRYSRSALPLPCVNDWPGKTLTGELFQCYGIYFRDLCAPSNRALDDSLPVAKLLKLACTFELFCQLDSAAEILTTVANRLPTGMDLDKLLDMLVTSTEITASSTTNRSSAKSKRTRSSSTGATSLSTTTGSSYSNTSVLGSRAIKTRPASSFSGPTPRASVSPVRPRSWDLSSWATRTTTWNASKGRRSYPALTSGNARLTLWSSPPRRIADAVNGSFWPSIRRQPLRSSLKGPAANSLFRC